jgi:C1A family cysteine protease
MSKKTCRAVSTRFIATLSSTQYVKTNDEVALVNAVKTIGPIAVAIFSSSNFNFYKSGVFYDSACIGKTVNHAVVVVGYGALNGKDYYLIRNSWSTFWGING